MYRTNNSTAQQPIPVSPRVLRMGLGLVVVTSLVAFAVRVRAPEVNAAVKSTIVLAGQRGNTITVAAVRALAKR